MEEERGEWRGSEVKGKEGKEVRDIREGKEDEEVRHCMCPPYTYQRGGLVVSLRGRYRTQRWEIRVRIPGGGNAR